MSLKVIAFDADDTLWVNEPYFQETERHFCNLLEDYLPHHSISTELLKTEIKNLSLYGYGVKGFMLSMLETALAVGGKTLDLRIIEKTLEYGKELLAKDIELLPNVESVLQALQGKYRLIVATKGDLLDQERKLQKSGLEKYFHHIEIMSEKEDKSYEKLIKHLDIVASEFLMVGNSIKSDILPVLNIGGNGYHVPFHTTWALESVEVNIKHPKFKHFNNIIEILPFL